MEKIQQVSDLYESLKVEGRGKFCPRIGTYLITDLYQGSCYGKSALLAKAKWKPNSQDRYEDDFEVEVQLESFKTKLFGPLEWLNCELVVSKADYNADTRFFTLVWEVVRAPKFSLLELNNLLRSGDFNSMDALLNEADDFTIDDIPIDYGNDDLL